MKFLHDDREFEDLLRVVAQQHPQRIGVALIEKDYWVTHTLWSLQQQGFELWFKGGTSLSKGYGLVQRFSEDLDLKLEPRPVHGLPRVSNWSSSGARATQDRRQYFEALEGMLAIPGCNARKPGASDEHFRSRLIEVLYPGQHLSGLGPSMRPFVQLELGSARVTPAVERDLDSWVHAHVRTTSLASEFVDNRPLRLRCVHPLVTLLEKLDAISRRFSRETADPAGYVRHYEDAASIVLRLAELPALDQTPRQLADEMLSTGDLRAVPRADDPSFSPTSAQRWKPTLQAYRAIESLHWGRRRSLAETCSTIRSWLESL